MSKFRVGQPVVVVDDSPGYSSGRKFPLKRGSVTRIKGLSPNVSCTVAIEGDEVQQYWHEDRFRPLEEQSLTAQLAQKECERLVEERPEHVNEPVLS